MKKYIAFLLAVIIFFTLHEGLHALTALPFGEFEAFHIRPLGFEVTFNTPVVERSGSHWALISGASNIATILLGYLLLALTPRFTRLKSTFLQATAYYLAFLGLLLDPLNLSIGPLLYSGDAVGIAFGLGISPWMVQVVFGALFLLNHELLARVLVPGYGVETKHFLLRPWIGNAQWDEFLEKNRVHS
jgi:hypothetical protein